MDHSLLNNGMTVRLTQVGVLSPVINLPPFSAMRPFFNILDDLSFYFYDAGCVWRAL